MYGLLAYVRLLKEILYQPGVINGILSIKLCEGEKQPK